MKSAELKTGLFLVENNAQVWASRQVPSFFPGQTKLVNDRKNTRQLLLARTLHLLQNKLYAD
jgi:hypothetical protein